MMNGLHNRETLGNAEIFAWTNNHIKMKIEIWSDIACPYCYIAMVRLHNAVQSFEYKDVVTVAAKSFELEPEISVDGGESQHEAVMRKYRQSAFGAQQVLDQAGYAAKTSGISINWDQVITTNSFDAHRLIKFAATHGKAREMEERLYSAYFTDGKHIADRQTLTELAAELGLDAKVALEDGSFSEAVRRDEQEARTLGVHAVPYLLFDNKYSVSGARSEADYLDLLYQMYQESMINGVAEVPRAPGCVDGSCTI
jgi:predicted DsbA family dithiol-disulfide isomerase